jgi:hypothetical protein
MLTFIETWQSFFFGTKKLEIKSISVIPDTEIDILFVEFRDALLKRIQESESKTVHPAIKTALFLQGILNPNAKDRKNGLPVPYTVDLANEMISTVAREVRMNMYRELLAEKVKILSLREAEKRKVEIAQAAAMQQEEFLKLHPGNARSFTYAEIREMNKSRPISDQLSLTSGSHMLYNHCGYPTCPYYLKNLSTESDIRFGTNSGLWGHLHGFSYPKAVMISGFHSRSFTALRSNPRISKEDFVARLLSEFDYHIRSKNRDKAEVTEELEEIWNTWQKWGCKEL